MPVQPSEPEQQSGRASLPTAQAAAAPLPRTWARGMRHAGGFLLLVTGIPLLISPVPVAPAIFLGLNLLKDDYAWARRLMERLRTTQQQLRSHFPQSRLQLGQATLRRQLFGRRLWWRKATVTAVPTEAATLAPSVPPAAERAASDGRSLPPPP